MKNEDLRLFTYQDVAEILECSEKSVFNRVKDGALQPIRIGRLVRFSEKSIEDFLERSKQIEPLPLQQKGLQQLQPETN